MVDQERLFELKEEVKNAYFYFEKNYKRFHEFTKFVYDSTLTSMDLQKLSSLGKPQLEFNVIESIVSRLIGEFVKQEPSIVVKASDGVSTEQLTENYLEMIKVLEGHMKELIIDASSDGLQSKIYTDEVAGGYSVGEVYIEYLNDMSFDQKITVKRVFDPTLTGFDPLARESHKGDGRYCFELVPWSREKFEKEFGKERAIKIKFTRGGNVGDFSWSYNNSGKDIVLICSFYEKRLEKTKIVKLSTGHVVTESHYKELLDMWNEQGFIEQAPVVVAERTTEIETIWLYRFCETEIISEEQTYHRFLPLVFFDGNSKEIRDSEGGNTYQMTRPLVYQAKGIQQLKNFAGQCLGQEMENLVQHKFKVSIESIPEDYKAAYQDIQKADVLVYNQFYKNDPQNPPLTPPQEIQRPQIPAIIENVFYGSDKVTQTILGTYDSVLGTNEKDISGVAIANGSIATSAAAMPYTMGYIHGLNRIAQILLDLIPKIYVTPRTIPVIKSDGKRTYQLINDPNNPNSINLSYKSNDLSVKVEAGVNTAIQKQIALDQIIKLTSASPLFAQFINTEGLEILLDNLDIRGIEELKVRAAKFQEGLRQQQEMASQQPDPMQEMMQASIQVEQQNAQNRQEEAEGQLAIKAAQVAIEKEKVDLQKAQILNDIEMKRAKLGLDQEKVDSENARSAVETAIALAEKHIGEHHEQVNHKEEE